MGDDIYLIGQDGAVVEMSAAAYDSEDILQRLLVDYPAVLAGAQIDRNNPRRWLLVDREVGIPAEEGGANRWAVDHVFLDQDGVPTLVEVKRSSDTRIRREVVGQMLDYAASAFACLPIETIRAAVEDRYGEEELAHFLEPDPDLDTFWTQVKTNLTAGRLRLLFVADVVPPELRRVVEFLNAQMDPAEVLAVEITQYAGANLRTLVPRVIGRSEQASRRKAAVASPTIRWDEGRFFADLGDKAGAEAVAVARRLLAWTWSVSGRVPGSLNVVWGRGAQLGSFAIVASARGANHSLFAAYTNGSLEIGFQWLMARPPFQVEAARRQLLRRLNAIDGVELPENGIAGRPNFPLARLIDAGRTAQFIAACEWAVDAIREASVSLPDMHGPLT